MKRFTCIGLILLGIILLGQSSIYAEGVINVSRLKIGDGLDNYSFKTPSGDTIKSSEFSYPLLISVFTTWCKLCKKELKYLEVDYQSGKNEKNPISIVAINAGERERSVRKYIKKRKLSLPVLIDSDLKFTKDLNIIGTPTVLLFNKEKTLIYQGNDLPKDWNELRYDS
ncbi:TlpA family protein disulfide reductase [bacterium]|jgi:thiol-disulfide isomerase/thioredoxin|nr:TlpA family protein disulfide reductase [bacterium]